MMTTREPWIQARLVAVMGILLLVIYVVTYATNRFGLPVRADGLGYFAYLPSYLIAHDPSMGSRAAAHYGGEFPSWSGIVPYKDSGKYIDRFNVGVAILMLPFYVLAHILTLTTQMLSPSTGWCRPDGYSFFYQHAAGLAGVVYVIAGLRILQLALRRWFDGPSIAFGLVALVAATDLANYGSGESVTSHAYSFFLSALLLYLVPRWYEEGMPVRLSFALGAVVGLIPLVRVTAALTLVFIPLYDVMSARGAADRARLLVQNARSVILVSVVALVTFIPQMAIWRYVTGSWLVNSYGNEGLPNLLHPELLNTLFSCKKGLFFWSPVLLAVVFGLGKLAGSARSCLPSVLLILPAQVYVIASAAVWYAGGSFGQRYFIDVLPFCSLPLCALYQSALSSRDRKWLWGFVAVCSAWSLTFMGLYYSRDLSYYGLDADAIFDILWSIKQFVLGQPG